GSDVVNIGTAGPAFGGRRTGRVQGPHELEMLARHRPHGRDYMPPRADVRVWLRRWRPVHAPFVPGAVHLATEVDNGTAESVLDQQFAEVIELRVVFARRGRNKSRAGCLEVSVRGIAVAYVQKGFNLRASRRELADRLRRARARGRDAQCTSKDQQCDQDRKAPRQDLLYRGHVFLADAVKPLTSVRLPTVIIRAAAGAWRSRA